MPYTPKKTVEIVRKTENHLLVQLKRNQPTLYERLLEQVVPQPAATVHHSHEVGQHNRLERRTVSVWPLAAGAGTEPWHDHFQTFIRVERQTDVFDTRRKAWTPREETAYYLATLPLTAAQAAPLIRNHWGIENRLHYVRDVTLREDACRIRRHPGLFAVLRSFALNLLRFNGIQNVSQALYDNALDFNRFLAYQGL
jgi:predicted transposase YbfD/YdcC